MNPRLTNWLNRILIYIQRYPRENITCFTGIKLLLRNLNQIFTAISLKKRLKPKNFRKISAIFKRKILVEWFYGNLVQWEYSKGTDVLGLRGHAQVDEPETLNFRKNIRVQKLYSTRKYNS